MSFWLGFSRGFSQAQDRKLKRELFLEETKRRQQEIALSRRAKTAEATAEVVDEDVEMIERAGEMLGDIDYAAALYRSGQLESFMEAASKPFFDGKINRDDLKGVISVIEERYDPDDLEGTGNRLVAALRSADLGEPGGLQAAITAAYAGTTLEDMESSAPYAYDWAEIPSRGNVSGSDYSRVRGTIAESLIGSEFQGVARIEVDADGNRQIVKSTDDPQRFQDFISQVDGRTESAMGRIRKGDDIENVIPWALTPEAWQPATPAPAPAPAPSGQPAPAAAPQPTTQQPQAQPAPGPIVPTAPPYDPNEDSQEQQGDEFQYILDEEYR